MSTLQIALLIVVLASGVRAGMRRAICEVEPNPSKTVDQRGNISGTVEFSQDTAGGNTTITVSLTGLLSLDGSNNHGFHVHDGGNMSRDCEQLAGHYNPAAVNHGGPDAAVRHVGDLGNVMQDSDGNVMTTIVDHVVSLMGDHSVIGHSIVVHADEDDLGLGGVAASLTTGDAGLRQGCCIIMLTDDGNDDSMDDMTTTMGSTEGDVSGTDQIQPITVVVTSSVLMVLSFVF